MRARASRPAPYVDVYRRAATPPFDAHMCPPRFGECKRTTKPSPALLCDLHAPRYAASVNSFIVGKYHISSFKEYGIIGVFRHRANIIFQVHIGYIWCTVFKLWYVSTIYIIYSPGELTHTISPGIWFI